MTSTSPESSRYSNAVDFGTLLERYGLAVFCGVLVLVTASISPAFRSPTNIQNVFTNVAPLGIVVLGQAMVIIVRGFDLSIASMMATAAVIATQFDGWGGMALPATLVTTLVVSLIVGFANGFLVTKRNMSPFLATLATMIMLQGVRFAWTRGAPSGRIPPELQVLGTGQIYGIPLNLILLAILALFVWTVLTKTSFGRSVYMIGGNPRAAELVGVKVDRTVIACYMASAVLAGIGGLVLVGYVSGVDNWVGRGYELDSVIAAVMGGVALSGGRGSVLGGILGAFLLTVIFNIVLLLGFPVQFQFVVKGMIIILAMAIYRFGGRST
ncbi:MAG: ABC transporter permease [Rhizobiaceae bacterium]|nr:ABC transporter permease [Rhizobiaceae bacterium]